MNLAIRIISILYMITHMACSHGQQGNNLISPKELSQDFEFLIKTLDEMNPDLYAFTSRKEFDRQVEKIRNEIENPMSLLDFYLRVSYLVHSIKQGHTQASYMLSFWRNCDSGMIPLNFRIINNQLFIKDNYSSDTTLIRGTEILSINGIPSAKLIDTLYNYSIRETETFSSLVLEGKFPYYLWMVYQFNISYAIEYILPFEQEIETITLNGLGIEEYGNRRYTKKMEREYSFHIDENDIGILKASSFSVKINPYKTFVDSVFHVIYEKKINNLIIDIRDNDGGDIVHGYLMLDYLASEPMRFADKPKFKGNLYVLTNGLVFSSALPFAYLIKDYNLGTIVGEETGIVSPAFGEPLRFKLPNSQISIMNSTCTIIRPSGIVNNRGVIPDYIVEPNILDLIRVC